ncbi:SMC-Scp complex subunit ScpB [Phascolarctobacterium succinatutens]|uniref:SMC-Scp complex subunit ScpB n=1 Tax=Phascolarctobacterium succinatutens TaxID=626940 RepID=UPI0023F99EC9|nr:SMC-Scp complex subunit ScpB [Phascolarctobacterium succinatutens]
MYLDKMTGALEAVLFAAGEPVSVAELADLLQLDKPQVWELVSELKQSYEAESRGLMLRETAGYFQLVTKPVYYNVLLGLGRKKEVKLTNASLETLAIVAFKQPVTRAEMEAIRGVKVDGVLNTLLDLGLVAEAGRKKALGNPILYATTEKFLMVFGLNSLEELPPLETKPEDEAEAAQQVLQLDNTLEAKEN